jgi:Domain of unknown function (DUF4159)
MPKRVTTLALAMVISLACLALPAEAAVTDDDIQQAIDKGVEWLFSRQKDNGWFSPKGYFSFREPPPEGKAIIGGLEAMAMLALTFAPVDIKDERMLKGFDALLKFDMKHLYARAPRVMVICRLLNKLDRERRERAVAVLKQDIAWIIAAQNAKGAWGYGAKTPESYGWDFSNTQMAILALQEADMAGIELPQEPFLRVQKLYLDTQRADGGWNYGMRGGFQDPAHPDGAVVGSYGSMTAAAVATLFITRDFLYRGIGCPCKSGRSGRRPKQLDDAIDRGLQWLGEKFMVTVNPLGSKHHWKYYWLYSCERVGLAAGIKYFGTHDWYREGAVEVVGTQLPDGSWSRSIPRTSYAICFLAKGRAPILLNKLKHRGQWNNHPRDAANLSRYVGDQKETPFNWQVITFEAPVPEWHDAPVLYITVETVAKLTDAEKRKLRRYTDTGGTILFEASCGNRGVNSWWQRLVKELWPEWELKRLQRKHPLFSSDTKMRRIPKLQGMNDGIRTFLFYSNVDISCPWNTVAVTRRRELFDLGTNLYVYAGDRRPLRARLAAKRTGAGKSYAETTPIPGKRPALTLARVKHGGDWYTGKHYDGPGVLARSLGTPRDPEAAELQALQQEAGITPGDEDGDDGTLKLKTIAEIDAAALDPAKVHVAYLAGRQSIGLSDADIVAMKKYVAGGGFLLVEATMGDIRADAAWRLLAPKLGLVMKPIRKGHPIVTGQMDGATGYVLDRMHYCHALKAQRIGKPYPALSGLYAGDKLVGVYSPFDLMYCHAGYSAWNCRGYAPDDALAILTNILLHVSTQ